ncbi:MAG: ABC transporter ATP-binding protein [Caldilineaceae bacterium]|uniref:ABC transporter ATP-binding protein n=1 Tax=Caldilineaceae bacterium SB0661_bin_32 TaxID=2605255 RepID=A0A6B1D3Z1_9CHLR|nr:ABC transporter ATP-binding protein [Caldilineaceae bacterium]MXZ21665.1 ABC transporter ATP-binding protein [Caldilineaceae bacterium SB0665_bin_25]MYC94571.1 ABC transporter ATP-binding protein [Caldilineaceae bacterium SB0661_bin_32]
MEQQEPVLELRDLHTYFPLEEGLLKAVNGVSLTIHKNRTLGVVGESGCGKSVTAQSILRIVPEFAHMTGEILLHQNGHITDLAALAPSGKEIRDIRGRDISMIFQEPMTAFSPVHTVGDQIMEAILVHEDAAREEARSRAVELLSLVGIPMPEERVDAYPHQLSGGMRQRAMIAMALALKPKLLIADEPTTALDVTIQAQILRLMKTLQAEMGMSIMFITHDLGVIANMADEVAVMYLGRVVEFGSVRQIFRSPQHPYTQALLRSIPRTGHRARVRLDTIEGIVPVPLDPPDICPFSERCTQFIPGRCDEKVPDFLETEAGHSVRCILYE